MNLLYQYSKQYWKLFVVALLLAATNQIFSLLDPLIFRHVIDSYATKYHQYTQGQFIRGAGLLLLAAVGVAFVSRVAKNFQDYFVNVIVQRLGAQHVLGRNPAFARFALPGLRRPAQRRDAGQIAKSSQRCGAVYYRCHQCALHFAHRHRVRDDLRLPGALVDCSGVSDHGSAARNYQLGAEQADQEDAEDHCCRNHRAGGFDNRVAAQY